MARYGSAAAVAALAALCHANTLGGALVMDDVPTILENDWVVRGDLLGILTKPSWWGPHTSVKAWRPLTTLSFALDWAVHGAHPLGYHLVNVGLHVGVALLVLAVFARLGARAVAVGAALLFAVHPIHTEAVASVVGRAELLAAAGVLSAWACFLLADAARDRAGSQHPGAAWEAAGMIAFFLGLLAKENAITLVPVLLLADALASPPGGTVATWRRHGGRYAALIAVAALYLALRTVVVGGLGSEVPALDNPLVTLPVTQRWLTAVGVVGLYAERLLLPLRLSADYSAWQIPPVTSVLDPRFLAGVAVLTLVPALAWRYRRRVPLIALGLGFMAITFALISNLLFLVGTLMAERWLYLPSAGFCVAGAAACTLVAPGLAATPARVPRGLAIAAAVLLVAAGARTWNRSRVWATPESFFTAMVRDAPGSSRAHSAFADVLADRGQLQEALAEYERALAIEPKNWQAEYNLGNARLKLGDVDGAVAAYERALAVEPTFSKAVINLGAAESRRGNFAKAIATLRRALILEPDLPSLHVSLANVLAAAGDRPGARVEFETALTLAPGSPDALADFGAFLVDDGRPAEAIPILRRSLAIRPDVPERHVNLGYALVRSGDLAAAEVAYRRALELRPGYARPMEDLGNVASMRGDHEGALAWFRRAEAAGPASALLHGNIANELGRLGRRDEARAEYETALALDPNAGAVRANYSAFLAAEGGTPGPR